MVDAIDPVDNEDRGRSESEAIETRQWLRSEERRVGQEGRSRGAPCH